MSYNKCQGILFWGFFYVLVLFVTIWTSVLWYLTVLICISLKTSDTKHLFIYLFAISMSFLVKSVFKIFVHIFIEFLASLHILDTSHLPDVWFENIFSQYVLTFHAVSKIFSNTSVLHLVKDQFFLFLSGSCFWGPS